MADTGNNELTTLQREVRRLQRELDKCNVQITRIQNNNQAKAQFAEIVLAERSRLERNMNLMLANSRDFVLFFDVDGDLIFVTDSFVRAIGAQSPGMVKGKNAFTLMAELMPREVTLQVKKYSDAIFAGAELPPLELQTQADLDKSGQLRDYHINISKMSNEAGEHEGWLCIFYDVSDLVQAKRDAEQANQAKSDFLATVSHEIRTPMNAIVGLTRMMEVTPLSDQQRGYLNKMKISSNTLLDLINGILDFSKIEAGKLGLVEEYFDFRGLLEGLQSLFELLMSQKELAFHARFAPDLPQVVYADPKRLRQILTNLVNNAYKYTPSGWVDFIVARTPDGQIRFDIRDTGIGIREQDLGKLFQAFEQVDIQRNRHISGTGLGLAITRQLAELMGGSVGVSSVYGEGSTFWVTLPLREGRPEDLPHVEATCYEFTAPAARILIADDVPMNIEIAEFMLESYEITAERAVDGEQALRQVAAQHFDLILMDHMMPRMDGVEATRRIRQLPADGPTSPQVPIIAMTANAGIGVENMFLDAGFDGYIAKPMETCAFSSALYHHLPRQLIRE